MIINHSEKFNQTRSVIEANSDFNKHLEVSGSKIISFFEYRFNKIYPMDELYCYSARYSTNLVFDMLMVLRVW